MRTTNCKIVASFVCVKKNKKKTKSSLHLDQVCIEKCYQTMWYVPLVDSRVASMSVNGKHKSIKFTVDRLIDAFQIGKYFAVYRNRK